MRQKIILFIFLSLSTNVIGFDKKEFISKSRLSEEDIVKLEKIAENNKEAALLIGQYYQHGLKVKRDHKKAIKFLSLIENNPTAYLALADIFYRAGNNVERNKTLAEEFYKKASKISDHAKYYYGLALEQNLRDKPMLKEAYDVYFSGINTSSNCLFRVAVAHHYGKAVKQDFLKAAYFYQSAMLMNNHLDSTFALSQLKRFGRGGIPRDTNGALHYCAEAAAKGHRQALITIVPMSIHTGNLEAGLFWYFIASEIVTVAPELQVYKPMLMNSIHKQQQDQIKSKAKDFMKKNNLYRFKRY